MHSFHGYFLGIYVTTRSNNRERAHAIRRIKDLFPAFPDLALIFLTVFIRAWTFTVLRGFGRPEWMPLSLENLLFSSSSLPLYLQLAALGCQTNTLLGRSPSSQMLPPHR